MGGKRERWDSRTVFILAAIGSAIGLGNVWRYPYVAYANGGGAFLIPYFVALLCCGLPILILEMGVGQYFQAGASTAFKRARPWFEFVGWWAILIATVITFYYCAIMAYAFSYLFYAFTVEWAQPSQNPAIQQLVSEGSTLQEAFFKVQVQNRSAGIEQIGSIQFPLLVGLILTWLWIYYSIRKGVKSVGKMVMITVPLPFILLFIIFFRAVSLPGAMDGLVAYLTPKWEALGNPSVWAAAVGQIFFSLSVGFGVMTAYASFRPKKADIVNSALITGLSNSGTEFFAGFAVFSVLGFLAHQLSIESGTLVTVDKVVSGGFGLAFVTFPTAIHEMGGWAVPIGVMFFLMLLTLGIDSAFSLVEAASTAISDELQIDRHKVTIWLCWIGAIAGLLFITQAGFYWLDVVDHWMNAWGLVIIGFLEVVFFGWFFNIEILRAHLDKYGEIKAGPLWVIIIKFVAPIILGWIIIGNFFAEIKEPYSGYPVWTLLVGGWGLTLLLLALSIWLSFMKPVKKSEVKS